MYDKAIEDLDVIVKVDPENAKAHFYKGKILSKEDQHSESILHFEQVIKYNQEPFLSCNALLEIAKLKIKERNFYEAHYNLKRITLFNFKSAKLDQYQTFTEGVLYLIKRKVKKGVHCLSSLVDGSNSKSMSSATTLKPKIHEPSVLSTTTLRADQAVKEGLHYFLKPLVYIYRAFGYISLEQYDKAINDLVSASKISKLDQASQYNRQIALGFAKLQKGCNEEAQTIFKKASFGDFKKNKEPYLLQIISIISSSTYSENYNEIIDVDFPNKRKKVNSAIKVLNSAIEESSDDLTLYYYRGLLLFYLHRFFEAFLDFDYIVEKEDEPHSKYYLARGK